MRGNSFLKTLSMCNNPTTKSATTDSRAKGHGEIYNPDEHIDSIIKRIVIARGGEDMGICSISEVAAS